MTPTGLRRSSRGPSTRPWGRLDPDIRRITAPFLRAHVVGAATDWEMMPPLNPVDRGPDQPREMRRAVQSEPRRVGQEHQRHPGGGRSPRTAWGARAASSPWWRRARHRPRAARCRAVASTAPSPASRCPQKNCDGHQQTQHRADLHGGSVAGATTVRRGKRPSAAGGKGSPGSNGPRPSRRTMIGEKPNRGRPPGPPGSSAPTAGATRTWPGRRGPGRASRPRSRWRPGRTAR